MPQRTSCPVDLCRAAPVFARLFSGSLCASRIASKTLHQSKRHLIKGLVVLSNQNGIEPVGPAVIEWPHRNFVQVSTE